MSSNMELVEFPTTSSEIVEELSYLKEQFRYLKEQMKDIKEQLTRRDESQRVVDGDDLSSSFNNAVEDATDIGIDNATFTLPSPKCHTIDTSLGK